MSLSTIASAIGAAARDFAGHTSSTPPTSYFRPGLINGADEDPWEGWPEHEMERARARLSADTARRQALADAGLRTGSRYERQRLGLAVAL